MEPSIVRTTLSLISPGILLVFGVAFAGAWFIERRHGYLLLLAVGCAMFALGATSQILHWPPDSGHNAIFSGILYTAAVLFAVEGVLLRSDRRFGSKLSVAVLIGFTLLLTYFVYVSPNLLARVYLQNFGYGAILIVAAIRLRPLMQGRAVDRLLFWVFLAFGLHFFPRTMLTIGFSAPVGKAAFANSLFWQALQLSLAVLGAALAVAILAATVADLIDDLRNERDTDSLTGVMNRRGFEQRATRVRGSTSLILCDLDNFKTVNDTYGHAAGDTVLREVGRLLRQCARKGDFIGRLGGEEFALLLPNTSPQEAFECAERLRAAIERNKFNGLPEGRQLTASFGVGTIEFSEDWPDLYERVDARLYAAKRGGRNRTMGQPVASGRENPAAVSKPGFDQVYCGTAAS